VKNYIQPGKTITVLAPADRTSGAPVKVGGIFGVAAFTALSGAELEVTVEGVFELAKDNNLVISQGDWLYYDAANDWLDKTSSGSPTPQRVGYAVAAAAQTATTVKVKLTPGTLV
jgi:predicted RecA/RadA family phage recombinase